MDAKETTLYATILISSMIIGTIFIYFIFSIIRQQRRHLALYKRAIEAEIRTLEKERARMAADLHDEMAPVLSAVKFQASSLDVSDEDAVTVEKMNSNLDGLVEKIRSITDDLMPVVLLRRGLVAAIEDLLKRMKPAAALELTFTHENFPDLPAEKALHLYRITSEILHNTIKHARATRFSISLRTNNTAIFFQTEDNGCGFDYQNSSRKPGGHGLNNLLSRAELLGGQLFVESVPGKGTIFYLAIPFNSQAS